MSGEFTTDGATLPLFFRRWIARNYPGWVLERIDRAGRFHDWLVYRYPNSLTHDRRRFVKLLRRFNIPRELVFLIHLGLWVYDHCPPRIKKKLQQTAGRHD